MFSMLNIKEVFDMWTTLYLVLATICLGLGLFSDNLYLDISFFGCLIMSGIERIIDKLENKQ